MPMNYPGAPLIKPYRVPYVAQSDILDYKDPLEINSVLDVLFNEAALNKNVPNPLDVPGAPDLGDLLQRVQGLGYYYYKGIAKPIIKSITNEQGLARLNGFGPAFMNTLQNFGETMDVLANPVKGIGYALVEGHPENIGRNIVRSLGVGKEGRYNYDVNTGNIVADIGLEIASDPFNWMTLGAWAIGKAAVSAAKPAVKALIKETVPEIAEDLAQKATKQILKEVRKNPDELEKVISDALKGLNVPGFGRPALNLVKEVPGEAARSILPELAKTVTDNVALETVAAMQKLSKFSDVSQNILMKSVGMSTGIIPTWWLIKQGATPVSSFIKNRVEKALAGTVDVTKPATAVDFIPAIEAARENLKSILKNPTMPKDAAQSLELALEVRAFSNDMSAIQKILTKGGDPVKMIRQLDNYFVTNAGIPFKDYVTFLKDFSTEVPDFAHHYRELDTIKNIVDRAATEKSLVKPALLKDTPFIRALDTALQKNDNGMFEYLLEVGHTAQVKAPAISADLLNNLERVAEKFRTVSKITQNDLHPYATEFERLHLAFKTDPGQYAEEYYLFLRDLGLDNAMLQKYALGITRQKESTEMLLKDVVEYSFLQTRAKVSLQFLENEKITRLVEDINTKENIGALLELYKNVPGASVHVTALQHIALSHQHYTRMLATMQASEDLQPLFANIFDVLQGFRFENLDDASLNRESFINKVLNKLKVQVTSIEADRAKLEFIFEGPNKAQYDQEFSAFLQKNGFSGIQAHDAEYDLLKVMFLYTKDAFLKRDLDNIDLKEFLPVFFDLETTGTKEGSDKILQIAWRTMEGQSGNIVVQAPHGLVPSEDVLCKLTGETDPQLAHTKYVQRFMNKDLPEHADAIKQFQIQLQQLEVLANSAKTGTVRKLKMIGWNNDTFDMPFLLSAMRNSNNVFSFPEIEFFRLLDSEDGLKMLHRMREVPEISRTQENELRKILNMYLETRALTITGTSADSELLMETVNGEFGQLLHSLNGFLKEKKVFNADTEALMTVQLGQSYSTATKTLDDAVNEIFSTLRDVEIKDLKYHQSRVFRDNITGVFLDQSGREIPMGQAVHIGQAMFSGLNTLAEGAPKIEFDMRKMKRVFGDNLKQLEGKPDAVAHSWYKLAKEITDTAQAVRNTPNAVEFYVDYGTISLGMQYFIRKNFPNAPKILLQVQADAYGTFDRYAVAKLLYDRTLLLSRLSNKLDDFADFVEEHGNEFFLEKAYETIFYPGDMFAFTGGLRRGEKYTSTFFALDKKPLYRSIEAYQTATGGSKVFSDLLHDVSLIKDTTGMASMAAQSQAAILKKFVGIWQDFEKYLYAAPGTEFAEKMQKDLLHYINSSALSELEWVSKLPAADLEDYLWFTHGRLTFATPLYENVEYRAFMQTLHRTFKEKAADLEARHIHYGFDEQLQRSWLWLDNNEAYVQTRVLQEKAAKDAAEAAGLNESSIWEKYHINFQPYFSADKRLTVPVQKTLNDLKDEMALITHNKSTGSLGDLIDIPNLEGIDAQAPLQFRKNFIGLEVFKDMDHFNGITFNRTNIGLPVTRRQLAPFVSGDILKNYENSSQAVVAMLDAKTKLTAMFFDPSQSLSGPLFENLTPEDILETIQKNPHLRVAGLVQDPKFGPVVREFKLRTLKDVQFALSRPDLNITVLSPHVYLAAYKAINDFKVGGSALQWLNKYIVGPTKAGYLTSLGFVFRNIVDSTIKNIALAGQPTEAFNMVRHTLETAKHYGYYIEMMKNIAEYNDGVVINKSKLFSKRILERIYELNPDQKISKDLFDLMHDFIIQGPSAGMSNEQQKVIDAMVKASRVRKGLPEEDELYKAIINNGFTAGVLSANSALEQIFRLSGYTWELSRGASTDTAMGQVLKHHFDYGIKTKAEMYADYVIPFTSFSVNNTKFWLDNLDKVGWLAAMYRDFYTPIWNFDERTLDDLNRNRSLQYHITAGNLILDNGLVIKLNPSVFDALKLLTNPSEIISRIGDYISVPVDALTAFITGDPKYAYIKNLLVTIPMIGPVLTRYWDALDYLKEGTVTPQAGSAVVAANRLQEFTDKVAAFTINSIFGSLAETYQYSPWPKKTYARRKYIKFKKPKKLYMKKIYPKALKKGRRPNPNAAMNIMRMAKGRPMRFPGGFRKLANTSPAIYKKLYTGTGQNRFITRMIPITTGSIKSRLRSDWAYLRL